MNIEIVMYDVSPNVQYDVLDIMDDTIVDISGIYLSL